MFDVTQFISALNNSPYFNDQQKRDLHKFCFSLNDDLKGILLEILLAKTTEERQYLRTKLAEHANNLKIEADRKMQEGLIRIRQAAEQVSQQQESAKQEALIKQLDNKVDDKYITNLNNKNLHSLVLNDFMVEGVFSPRLLQAFINLPVVQAMAHGKHKTAWENLIDRKNEFFNANQYLMLVAIIQFIDAPQVINNVISAEEVNNGLTGESVSKLIAYFKQFLGNK